MSNNWSLEETRRLIDMARRGYRSDQMARELGRSANSIQKKLMDVGIYARKANKFDTMDPGTLWELLRCYGEEPNRKLAARLGLTSHDMDTLPRNAFPLQGGLVVEGAVQAGAHMRRYVGKLKGREEG